MSILSGEILVSGSGTPVLVGPMPAPISPSDPCTKGYSDRSVIDGNKTLNGTVGLGGRAAQSDTALCLPADKVPINIPMHLSLANPPVSGNLEFDGMFCGSIDPGLRGYMGGTFFSQTLSQTVTGQDTDAPNPQIPNVETSLIAAAGQKGTLVLPAGTLKAGRLLWFKCFATIKTAGAPHATPSATMRFYLNGTQLNYPSTLTLATMVNPTACDLEVMIQCLTETNGATLGTVRMVGRSIIGSTIANIRNLWSSTGGTQVDPVDIDTSIDQTIGFTYQWGDRNGSWDTVTTWAISCKFIH